MSETGPMMLTEFLLARIAEDEQEAERASARGDGLWSVVGGEGSWDACRIEGDDLIIYDEGGRDHEQAVHIARHDPARVLAECEAKRRIVTEVHHRAGDAHGERREYLSDWQKESCEGCGWGGPCDDYHVEHVDQCPTLRLLALPHADHPDYRPEWRP